MESFAIGKDHSGTRVFSPSIIGEAWANQTCTSKPIDKNSFMLSLEVCLTKIMTFKKIFEGLVSILYIPDYVRTYSASHALLFLSNLELNT